MTRNDEDRTEALAAVLASHRFSFTKSVDGTDGWGWCAGGDSWHTQPRAEHEAHVATLLRQLIDAEKRAALATSEPTP